MRGKSLMLFPLMLSSDTALVVQYLLFLFVPCYTKTPQSSLQRPSPSITAGPSPDIPPQHSSFSSVSESRHNGYRFSRSYIHWSILNEVLVLAGDFMLKAECTGA